MSGELERVARTTAVDKAYGITDAGFVPKPVARLLEEKIAAARELFGPSVDLTSGSALRTVLELVAVEESRLWTHLGQLFADSHVCTATGEALSRLGAELGIARPFHRATGRVTIAVESDLPADLPELVLPRGSRLRARGGTEVFLTGTVRLTDADRSADAPVTAFLPGPSGDLDPAATVDGDTPGLIDRFSPVDARVARAAALLAEGALSVTHQEALTGGSRQWADEPYRDLLLAAPRTIWTPDAVRIAVALVPGVRQVIVKDLYGGLDINQSIFGNFSFAERLFAEQRGLGSPYFVTVLVAPEEAAVWDGPGQLAERVREAVDTVRPIGIAPSVEQASLVGVGFQARLVVEGLPVATGPGGSAGPEVAALLGRITDRVRRYVGRLRIGEPVRFSEVMWALMNEPGVVDARDLRLLRYPPLLADLDLATAGPLTPTAAGCGQDVEIGPAEVAVLVDDPDTVTVV